MLLFQGGHVPAREIYNAFSYAVTVVAIVLLLWERYLWHYWPFQPYLHTKPNLRGTWKGELVSDYRDPDTHEEKPPIEV